MTKKIRASQIGFFGLNGARVILGLTILIIIDGIFSFNVIDALLESKLPGSVLALIFALIIASANLLGLVISQFLDKFMVYYLKRVNDKRLAEFKENIEQENENELPDISLYDLYFDGETWNDSNLLPYKQEVMTRWILVLALLLIGYSLSWRESNELIEGCITGFSQFISDFSRAILLGTVISLNFILLSLKLVTERKLEDALKEWGKYSLLLSSIIIYPIIQVEFDSNSSIDFIFIILLLILIFILSDSYVIYSRTSSDNKLWVKVRGRIKKRSEHLSILLFVLFLLILVDTIQLFSNLNTPTPVLLFPVLLFVIFIYLSLLQIYKKFKQKIIEDNESEENKPRIFGTQTDQKVVQWCDLIVMYYELFFYKVNYETLSKLEAYQLVINGAYVYQLIYQYLVKGAGDTDKMEKRGENKTLGDIEIIEIDEGNLEYIKYLNGFIDTVKIELDREKLDTAMRFYSSLNEAILAYFVSSSFLNATKSSLAEKKALFYVIDSKFAGDLIERISKKETLRVAYEEVAKESEEIGEIILHRLLQNQDLNEESLKKIVEEESGVENLARSINDSIVLERLSGLSELKFASIRKVVAGNSETSQHALERLSADDDPDVRSAVADNRNTPQYTLEKLSADDDPDVRSSVAGNRNTPQHTLEKLSTDDDPDVRSSVAGNRSILNRTLEKLSTDDDPDIRSAVADNRNTPQHTLEKLSTDDDPDVRSAVADNRNTAQHTLEKLSTDDKSDVRSAVADNRNTAQHTLEKLSTDDDPDVRELARNNLK